MVPTTVDEAAIRERFDACALGTVGLEEEAFVVDARSLEPVPEAALVVGRAADPCIKLELPACQLELATSPAATPADALAQLRVLRERALLACGSDLALVAAAVHPTAPADGAPLARSTHHRALARRYGSVAARQTLGALQVHVAVGDADVALAVHNALRSHLPELAALAAAAPFHDGCDTGLASVRPLIACQLPRQGVPPPIASWADLIDDLHWGAASGSVPEVGWWWWELRPHLAYGTLEVRVPDVQPTCRGAEGVATTVHALVAHLAARARDGEPLPVDPTWRIAENRWQALSRGLDGELADLRTGERTPARRVVHRLLDAVEPHSAAGLDAARELLEANAAEHLRRVGVAGAARWLAERYPP